MMRELLLLITLLAAAQAHADQTCGTTATERKLSGAAKSSLLKKCEADAMAACDAQAGVARTRFTKKCVKDAVSG